MGLSRPRKTQTVDCLIYLLNYLSREKKQFVNTNISYHVEIEFQRIHHDYLIKTSVQKKN